jgi:hypothetical protein
MQVTAGSGMQVKVAAGEAWVPGTSTATQSGYYGRVTSSTALSVATSSESNPRIDTIIAKVIDKAYAGTEETFSVAVITGTAESGATLANKKGAGAVPASSLVLAYVLVPAKASSIENADIENVAPRAYPTLGAQAFGESYCEWTSKSYKSVELKLTTRIKANFLFCIASGRGEFNIGVVSGLGTTEPVVQMTCTSGEQASGTKITFYWFAHE